MRIESPSNIPLPEEKQESNYEQISKICYVDPGQIENCRENFAELQKTRTQMLNEAGNLLDATDEPEKIMDLLHEELANSKLFSQKNSPAMFNRHPLEAGHQGIDKHVVSALGRKVEKTLNRLLKDPEKQEEATRVYEQQVELASDPIVRYKRMKNVENQIKKATKKEYIYQGGRMPLEQADQYEGPITPDMEIRDLRRAMYALRTDEIQKNYLDPAWEEFISFERWLEQEEKTLDQFTENEFDFKYMPNVKPDEREKVIKDRYNELKTFKSIANIKNKIDKDDPGPVKTNELRKLIDLGFTGLANSYLNDVTMHQELKDKKYPDGYNDRWFRHRKTEIITAEDGLKKFNQP